MESKKVPCSNCIHKPICPHTAEFAKLSETSEEYDVSAVFEIRAKCRYYIPEKQDIEIRVPEFGAEKEAVQ